MNAADYSGAVRAFAESAEARPRSAAAQFELGWLDDQKLSHPAAAIYHYEQYLKLDPGAGNADVVQQRVEICKRELAAAVLALPGPALAQQRIEELAARHEQLQDEIRQLRADLTGWEAYYARMAATRTSASPAASDLAVSPPSVLRTPDQPAQRIAPTQPPAEAQRDQLSNPACGVAEWRRTHTVVAGETAFGIARRYGVSLEALLAANPGLEPRRMAVGLVLNIPHHSASSVPASRLNVSEAGRAREDTIIASRTEPGLE